MGWFLALLVIGGFIWYMSKGNNKTTALEFIKSLGTPPKREDVIKRLETKKTNLEKQATELEKIKELKASINVANERIKRARE